MGRDLIAFCLPRFTESTEEKSPSQRQETILVEAQVTRPLWLEQVMGNNYIYNNMYCYIII